MVPNQFGPWRSGNTGTELVGDHLSRVIDFMGIVCPGGQKVGDRKSGDQMGSGPNASQPLLYMSST